jgi:hypothetical protein
MTCLSGIGHRLLCVALVVSCGGGSSKPAEPPSNHPSPSPSASPPPAGDTVFAWPVALYTKAQIAEVNACDMEKQGTARYPKTMKLAELPGAFATKTTCDQATLAAACGVREETEGDPTPACIAAYRTVLKANPAYAFANALANAYFGRVKLVAPPTTHALASITLAYEWGGLGTAVQWTVTASGLNGATPSVAVSGKNAKPVKSVHDAAAAVASLGTSIGDFMPIQKLTQAIDCTDNYPKWTASMQFDDGTKLELTTEGSNLIGLGGPWQMTVNGVAYMQLSPEFVQVVGALVKVLDLPIGQPMGAMCRGYDLQAEMLTP